MKDLKNIEDIKKLDPKNVLGSTELFTNQCEQMIDELKEFTLSNDLKTAKNIVFSGMGGSALGAQIVYYLYKDKLTIPFYINNDYTLPAFANEDTLVILSSYSGSTEETIASAKEAISRNCKITAITTGGDLSDILDENNISYLKFDPKNNPSGQPRLGTGYSVLAAIGILMKLGFIDVNQQELIESLTPVKQYQQNIKDEAIKLAESFKETIPLIFAGEFLVGAAHVLRNQFNETSKTFASYSPIPELNHHLMEGLKNPINKNLTVLVIESDLYSEKIKKRIELTKDVVKKNNISLHSYKAGSPDNLGQVLEVLSLGGYLTFYLSILYDQDPSLIPWVDYFKKELSK